jgi:hypothetical protein
MIRKQAQNSASSKLIHVSLLSIAVAALTPMASAGSLFSTTNTGNSITGETKDTAGNPVGVKGIANGFVIGGGSIASIGVEGLSDSATGTGVKGTGGTYGVYGVSTAGALFSPSYGVYGKGSDFSYAIYSEGATYVQGPLTITGDTAATNIAATNINATGDLTVAGAVNSNNTANAPVCANASGKLGPCNSLSYSSKVAHVGDGPGSYPSILGALFWSPSWCGTPSISSRCVIKVGPGTHDVGSSNLTLLNYFTIEGEGPDETIITGATAAQTIYISGLSGVVLRNLGIDNTSTGATRMPLRIRNSSDIRLENVDVQVGSGAPVIGIKIDDSDVAMKDTSIVLSTSGADDVTGIKVNTTSFNNISLDNVRIVSYAFGSGTSIGIETDAGLNIKDLHISFDPAIGILAHDSTTTIRHSFIDAYSTSIKTDGTWATVKVRFSELTNGTTATAGNIACTAVTSGSSFHSNTCP